MIADDTIERHVASRRPETQELRAETFMFSGSDNRPPSTCHERRGTRSIDSKPIRLDVVLTDAAGPSGYSGCSIARRISYAMEMMRHSTVTDPPMLVGCMKFEFNLRIFIPSAADG